MASSDDFKAKLKAGNITEALVTALSEAAELKFTTWVPSEDDTEATEAKPGHRLRTRINLIEGEVEHEVGDEFIGNGRYRELKQFHLEQVAEGSKLIQNNLKSLQKLFEVLVALRYPEAEPPVIAPESLDLESQLLPPVQDATDTGLVIESEEEVVTDSVVSLDTLTEETTSDTGWGGIPSSVVVTDAIATPDSLTEETLSPEQSLPSDEVSSSLTETTQNAPLLEEETDEEDDEDDWDDSVLDLLESLPVAPPPNQETSDSDLREDWGWHDLVDEEPEFNQATSDSAENQNWQTLSREDFASSLDIEPQNREASPSILEEDWQDFVEEESLSDPSTSDFQETQDWENLSREDFASPPATEPQNRETSPSESPEDLRERVFDELVSEEAASDSPQTQNWENFTREDFASSLSSATQDMEAASSELDEDWGDLVAEESDTELGKRIPNLDSLDLEEDEEWDDWVMDEPESPHEASVIDMDALDLGEEDDWGDLVEDPDPFPVPPAPNESASNLESEDDWGDLASEEFETSSDLIDFNTGIEGSFDLSETLDELTPPESALNSTDKADSNNEDVLEEIRLAEDETSLEESKPSGSEQQSDLQGSTAQERDVQPKSVDKRMPPPPPPPSRFPNQNN